MTSSEPRDELEAFLRTLENEGYPLEFEAAQAFADSGFGVSQSTGYFDSNGSAAREADVAARLGQACGRGRVTVSLAIECKSFRDAFLGIFVSTNGRPPPLVSTFKLGEYPSELALKQSSLCLDFPVDVHGFKAVLKAKGDAKRRDDPLWDAIQQALSARNGLSQIRAYSEAVASAAVLVTDATLVAVRADKGRLVGEPINAATVRVAAALGRPHDSLVFVQRAGLRKFAADAADAARLYLASLAELLASEHEFREVRTSEAEERATPAAGRE